MSDAARLMLRRPSKRLLVLFVVCAVATHHYIGSVITNNRERYRQTNDVRALENDLQVSRNSQQKSSDLGEQYLFGEGKIGGLADEQTVETNEVLGAQGEMTVFKQPNQTNAKPPDPVAPSSNVLPPHVLLLSSMGRSGSSFLGGLLNSQPGVFYVFEPLHGLQFMNLLTEDMARRSLRQIFTCNIRGTFHRALTRDLNFALGPQYFEQCRKTRTCTSAAKLNGACATQPIRVVKTIRTRVAWLKNLLEDTELNLKVIHLVRDPRASINSAKGHWDVETELKCDNLKNDLVVGQAMAAELPGRYMAVRYEDLCELPYKMSQIIFSFLGYKDLPKATLRFIENSTSETDGRFYGIRRNSRAQQQKWRQEISEQKLQEIEGVCSSVINAIGFNLFGDIERARNFSLPLYNRTTASTFFPYYEGR